MRTIALAGTASSSLSSALARTLAEVRAEREARRLRAMWTPPIEQYQALQETVRDGASKVFGHACAAIAGFWISGIVLFAWPVLAFRRPT